MSEGLVDSALRTGVTRDMVALALSTFDELALAVISTDAAGNVSGWNHTAQTLYGYRSEEALGKPIESLTVGPLEQEQAAEIMARLGQGHPWVGTFTCRRREGGFLRVKVADVCIVHEDGAFAGVLGISHEDRGDLDSTLEELRILRQGAREVQEIRSDAAREIAARLHDDLSQQCHGLLARTREFLVQPGISPESRAALEALQRDQEALVASLQGLWRSLRPALLDEFGVRAALEKIATDARIAGLVEVSLEVDDEADSLSNPLKEVIVLLTQEAVANVISHAKATRCSITVTLDDSSVALEVTDDGVGLDGPEGFGIRVMRDRVREFGGYLEFSKSPAGGTCLLVELEREWSPMAPLESLIDPHVMMKALRDSDGRVVDFVITDANDAALARIGRSTSSVIGTHLLDLWPDDRDVGLLDQYAHTVDTGEPLVVNNFVFPEESVELGRRYDFRAVKVGDSLSYTWRDVTERYDEGERFRLLAENVSDVVFRVDARLRLEWVSPSVTSALGWSTEELVGRDFVDYLHPDDAATAGEGVAEVVALGRVTTEVRVMDSTGEFHWVRLTVKTLGHGELGGFIGSFELIDDEHRIREEAQALQLRFRLLAENASDMVVLVDNDDCVVWVSPSVESFLGWRPEELVGRSQFDFMPPEDVTGLRGARSENVDHSTSLLLRWRRKDGSLSWVSHRGKALYDDDGVASGRVIGMRDVNVEQRQREELESSERRYRLLAENAADVISVADREGIFVYVSDAVTGLLSWTAHELVGMEFLSLVHPDDLSTVLELRRTGRVEAGVHYTVRLRRADGEYRWIGVGVRAAETYEGYPGARVASWRDAQAEVEAKQALEESQLHYRFVAEHSSDVVFIVGADDCFRWVSPSVMEMLGWRPDDLTGRHVSEVIVEEDLAEMMVALDEVTRGTKAHMELRVRRTDGQVLWVEATSRLAEAMGGQSMSRLVNIRNIDVERRQRIELEESKALYELLAENASDVVLLVAADGTITWASKSIRDVIGWTPEEILGTPVYRYVAESDVARVRAAHDDLTEDVKYLEVQMLSADGTPFWMSARSRVASSRDGSRIVALRDIQNEMEAREALITSETRFRLLAENSSDIVYQIDAEGAITWISPSVRRVLGWDPVALVGRQSRDLIFEEDLDEAAESRSRVLTSGEPASMEVRYKALNGDVHWMALHSHGVRGRAGHVTSLIVGLTVIDEQVRARAEMLRTQNEFKMIAESATDVVLRIDADSRIEWASPSVAAQLGWSDGSLVGLLLTDLLLEADREKVLVRLPLLAIGDDVTGVEVRFLKADGEMRWMTLAVRPMNAAGSAARQAVVSLTDCHAQVLSRRAHTTLSEGSRALMRSSDESQLLSQMCEIAVQQGGYLLAWYARKVDDEQRSVTKATSSTLNRDYVDEIDISWRDDDESGNGPTGRALRTGRTQLIADMHRSEFQPWYEKASRRGFRSSISIPVRIDGEVDGVWAVYAAEPNAFDATAVATLEDLASEIGYGLERLREQEKLRDSLREQLMLSAAIEQAGESIIVTDTHGDIIYANPSVMRTSGYSWEEIKGQNPRMFQSGLQDGEFYREMWGNLSGGKSWRRVFVNRRKNGEFYEEECTISPIHSAEGELVAFVAVKHDLTSERVLEANLTREQTDRAAVLEMMRDVRPATTLAATAYALCSAVTRVEGIDVACLMLLHDDGGLLPVGISGSTIFDVSSNEVIQPGSSTDFDEIARGPVVVDLESDRWNSVPGLLDRITDDGICCLIFAPVRWDGQLTAILALAARNPMTAGDVSTRMGHFEELGSFAGWLLGHQAEEFEELASVRRRVRETIDAAAFHPVFQAVVDLRTESVVGYEALTRFDDGVRPDLRFIEAAREGVGMGPDLEVACVRRALLDAERFPTDVFLSLNFSPEALISGAAARVLEGSGRSIVIEVTEHAEVENYGVLRQAVQAIPASRLAVDDAGAGYAQLIHIAELDPDFVKLDISLVQGVDSNPARQALVAGLCHFASQSGAAIIAEGVETPEELATLRELGAMLPPGALLAQGYLFSRPAPIDEILSTRDS